MTNAPPPEYVAALYAYLASERSAPTTGEIFAASGMYVGRFAPPDEQLLAWQPDLTEGGYTVDEIAAIVDNHAR